MRRAIQKADDWLRGHSADAQPVLQGRPGMEAPPLDEQWPRHRFSLSLDHTLILAMEDEGRRLMGSNPTDATSVPDDRK